MNLFELFDMGKYTFHVWTSWGLSLGALLTIVIINKRRNAKIRKELERQIRRENRIESD